MSSSVDGRLAFSLASSESRLLATGLLGELPRGGVATLASRVRAFFAGTTEGPRYLVGALPFDREMPDYLFQPARISFDPPAEPAAFVSPASTVSLPSARWTVAPQPTAAEYRDAVAGCLGLMAASQADADVLRKVVLSRSLTATADRPVDPAGLVELLGRDPSVTVFSSPLPGGRRGAPRRLIGATPELLVSKSGATVLSHPLAGSARRGGDPAADRRAAAALEASEKDSREHRAVVEAVLDTLAPYCSDLGTPDGTTLRPTLSIWHLGTRIVGRLRDRDTPVTELAAALHPTPAVCGLPRQRAAEVIRQLEGYDRGFYAGAVGWTDAAGDGAWHVSIRCAEIAGPRVRLYAGAGIVAGSNPAAEADETSAKFVALLSALGIDEQGRPLRGQAA